MRAGGHGLRRPVRDRRLASSAGNAADGDHGPALHRRRVAFRDEVRSFCREKIPAEIRRKVSEGRGLGKDDIVTSQRILNARGWAVPHWPKEWGGQDWTPIQRYIYTEELLQAAVPLPQQFNCYMFGPVLANFGNEAQKERFLARAANLDDWWCQGFSEPGAGSDLASLKTKAVRDGDHYVVNGQKTWTTLGQHADWIFCLVRTDPEAKKQRGHLLPRHRHEDAGHHRAPDPSPWRGHEVNEVFFDDVRVPVENLIGEENKGWDYAKFLLANERTGIARIGLTKERIQRIKRLAKRHAVGCRLDVGRRRFPRARRRGRDRAEGARDHPDAGGGQAGPRRFRAARPGLLAPQDPRLAAPAGRHRASGGTRGPVRVGARPTRGAGANNAPGGFDWVDAAAPSYFNNRKVSIYGGSNEIQHNVIAKGILGLVTSSGSSGPRPPSRESGCRRVGLVRPLGEGRELVAQDGIDHGFRLQRRAEPVARQRRALLRRRLSLAGGAGRRGPASRWGSREPNWGKLAELGVCGLPFSEEDGGFGGGAVETMIVMEAIGRNLAVEPVFASGVLGATAIRLGADSGAEGALVARHRRGHHAPRARPHRAAVPLRPS